MFKSFKLCDVNHDKAWHSNHLEHGYFFQFCGCKNLVNFAKTQKVNENCSAKPTCPEFPPKTFASWLPKFATEIKI
jgi:hypothetical protein